MIPVSRVGCTGVGLLSCGGSYGSRFLVPTASGCAACDSGPSFSLAAVTPRTPASVRISERAGAPIREDAANRARIPVREADVILKSPERRIILDTKFYRDALARGRGSSTGTATGKMRSNNLYQPLAYLRTRQATRPDGARHEGILLYLAAMPRVITGWSRGTPHTPQTTIPTPPSFRSSRNTFSAHVRPGRMSKTTRWPASVPLRSM